LVCRCFVAAPAAARNDESQDQEDEQQINTHADSIAQQKQFSKKTSWAMRAIGY
jgi:hypothetical protein